MEPKNTSESLNMAHKLETPPEIALLLSESAKAIGVSEKEALLDSLVGFKQNILAFMYHFNLDMKDFTSDMEDKRFESGGFTKRAVQKHSFKGAKGLRLVRDKLSQEFLSPGNDDLYLTLLNRKLEEETRELIEAMSRKERKEELGDVFEVFDTILDVKGITPQALEHRRQLHEINQRREKRKKLERKK